MFPDACGKNKRMRKYKMVTIHGYSKDQVIVAGSCTQCLSHTIHICNMHALVCTMSQSLKRN